LSQGKDHRRLNCTLKFSAIKTNDVETNSILKPSIFGLKHCIEFGPHFKDPTP